MKIYLAGYNIDTNTIEELKNGQVSEDNLTPETISAAYARISRDPRPVNELRDAARGEVEKSRKSNKAIIFGLGHSSVAEHAAFNFDIIGISRYAIEFLENFRLASYTEKSQRYITLDKDFVVPDEIKDIGLEEKFRSVLSIQNELYYESFEKLQEYLFEKHKDLLVEDERNKMLIEGWAKEDARYITSLATCGQLGMTVNARTLELMVKRFTASPIAEVRELGDLLYKRVESIAPSLVKYVEPSSYDINTYNNLGQIAKNYESLKVSQNSEDVNLVNYDIEGDNILISALLHKVTNSSFNDCRDLVDSMSVEEKEEIIKTSCKDMKFFDSVIREYEFPSLTFELNLSAACFGQLKRHRLATITKQDYSISNGVTIPESIDKVGLKNKFLDIIKQTEDLYNEILPKNREVASYILTNAHKRRVMMKINPRELYHLSRLREDAHAQWDIRNLSHLMRIKAQEIMPLTFKLISGKDTYNKVYEEIYG